MSLLQSAAANEPRQPDLELLLALSDREMSQLGDPRGYFGDGHSGLSLDTRGGELCCMLSLPVIFRFVTTKDTTVISV